MAEPETERTPWYRYAWAALLGLSLLGMTYVLFDPDLGTPVPLFQEFTCRGRLHVEAANGYDEPFLYAPEGALRARATTEANATHPAFFSVYQRDPGSDWRRVTDHTAPTGTHFFFIGALVTGSEVYVEARSLEGTVCKGRSDTLIGDATAVPPG